MIGEKIKELREANKFTQIELAQKLGATRSAVKAWELGVSIPSTQYIIKLAGIFNVSTDYLLENTYKITIDVSDLTEDQVQILCSLIKGFSSLNKK